VGNIHTFRLQPPEILQPVCDILTGLLAAQEQHIGRAEAGRTRAVGAGLGLHAGTASPCRGASLCSTLLLTGHSQYVAVQRQTWEPKVLLSVACIVKAAGLTVLKAFKTLRWAVSSEKYVWILILRWLQLQLMLGGGWCQHFSPFQCKIKWVKVNYLLLNTVCRDPRVPTAAGTMEVQANVCLSSVVIHNL